MICQTMKLYYTGVGAVRTGKTDNPWLCVDLGEEALIYSAGIFTIHNSKYSVACTKELPCDQ